MKSKMRSFGVAVTLAGVLFAPSISAASPVTLIWQGAWQFLDPYADSPQFHEDMYAFGITPLDPASGIYTDALLTLALTLYVDSAVAVSGGYQVPIGIGVSAGNLAVSGGDPQMGFIASNGIYASFDSNLPLISANTRPSASSSGPMIRARL